MSPPTHSSLLPNPSNQLMIFWVRRFLIQNFKRLPVQLRELPLEADPVDPRNIVTVVILHEQRQIIGIAELRSLDLQLLDVIRLANSQGLGGRDI